jgi:hypothetical protein
MPNSGGACPHVNVPTRISKGNNDFQFSLAGRTESMSIAESGAQSTWNDRDKV